MPDGYEEFADKLKEMHKLSEIIRKNKDERGYINFDVDEAKILVDENCHPYEITLRNRGRGENMIEDFMICANECVASHIFYMQLPFLYRVHEEPKEEKIRAFLSYLSAMGIQINGKMRKTILVDSSIEDGNKIVEIIKNEYPELIKSDIKRVIYVKGKIINIII